MLFRSPQQLVGWVSCVPVPAGTDPFQLVWNRCCVLLTSDPKILGVLGCLRGGESSGDHGTVHRVQAQVGLALAPTGRHIFS